MAYLGEHQFRVSADTRQAERQVRSFSDKIQGNVRTITGSLTRAGNQLSIALTAPLVLASKKIVSVGANIEQLARTAATVSSTNFLDSEGITRSAREIEKAAEIVGAATRFTNRDIAESAVVLARAGVDSSKIAEDQGAVLKRIADFASVAGTTITTATEISVRSMGAMGQAVNDINLQRFSDVLAVGANIAPTNMEELALAISYVGPIASTVGFDIEELTASLATLANAGIRGSRAGTGLARVITKLAAPSGPAAELMHELGIEAFDTQGNMKDLNDILNQFLQGPFAALGSGEQAAVANRLFGDRGGPAFINLLRGMASGELPRVQAALRNVENASGEMAASINDTTLGRLELLTGEIESFSGRLFRDVIRDPFNSIIVSLEQVVVSAGKLSTETLKIGFAFAGIAAAIGPLVRITGFFADNLAPLFRLFFTVGPAYVGPMALAIGSIATVITLAFENSENLRKSFRELGSTIINFFSNASGGFDPIITSFQKMREELEPVTTLIGDYAAKAVFRLVDAMKSADATITGGVAKALGLFPSIVEGLVSVLQEAGPNIRSTFENIGEIIGMAAERLPDDFAKSLALTVSTFITAGAEIAAVMSKIAVLVAPVLIRLLELILKLANAIIYLSDSFGPLSSALQFFIAAGILRAIKNWKASATAITEMGNAAKGSVKPITSLSSLLGKGTVAASGMGAAARGGGTAIIGMNTQLGKTGTLASGLTPIIGKKITLFQRLSRTIRQTSGDFTRFGRAVKATRSQGSMLVTDMRTNVGDARVSGRERRAARRAARQAAQQRSQELAMFRLTGQRPPIAPIAVPTPDLNKAKEAIQSVGAAAPIAAAKMSALSKGLLFVAGSAKALAAALWPLAAIMGAFFVYDRISTALRAESKKINAAGEEIKNDLDEIFSSVRNPDEFVEEFRLGLRPKIDFTQDVNGVIRDELDKAIGNAPGRNVGIEVVVGARISELVFGEGEGSFDDRLKNELLNLGGGELIRINVDDLVQLPDVRSSVMEQFALQMEDTEINNILQEAYNFFPVDIDEQVRIRLNNIGIDITDRDQVIGRDQLRRIEREFNMDFNELIGSAQINDKVKKQIENQVSEAFAETGEGLQKIYKDSDPYFREIMERNGLLASSISLIMNSDMDSDEQVKQLKKWEGQVALTTLQYENLKRASQPQLEGLLALGEVYKSNTTLLDRYNEKIREFNNLDNTLTSLDAARELLRRTEELDGLDDITDDSGQIIAKPTQLQIEQSSIAGIESLDINKQSFRGLSLAQIDKLSLITQTLQALEGVGETQIRGLDQGLDMNEARKRVRDEADTLIGAFELEPSINPILLEEIKATIEEMVSAADAVIILKANTDRFTESLSGEELALFEEVMKNPTIESLLNFRANLDPDSYRIFNEILPQFVDTVPLSFGVNTEYDALLNELLLMASQGIGMDLTVRAKIEGLRRLRDFGVVPDGFGEKVGANGGLFDEPTRMLIGEAGEEALIPLTRPARALSLIKQAGIDRMVINDMIKNGPTTSGATSVNAPKSITYAPQYNVHGVEPGQVVAYMKAREEADMARISAL